MIPKTVRDFVSKTEEILGDQLISIVLVGSFARGDETPSSAVDLFVLVSDIDNDILKSIGHVVHGIVAQNEINPAVISKSEIQNHPDLFDIHKIRHEGKTLYGSLPDGILPVESELDVAKRIAAEVLMGSRHYLAVAEPVEKFAGGKLWSWILKPLSYALRYYHFHNTGNYVGKYNELAQKFPILWLDPVDDHQRIIEGSIIICEKIINS